MADILRNRHNPKSSFRNPRSEIRDPRSAIRILQSLSIIVAMDEKGVIGHCGKLPWHLSSDLQRFKGMTMGHCLIMGRRTYESIGRPLPGRVSVVITRHPDEVNPAASVLTARGLEDAMDLVSVTKMDQQEVFVIGGAEIYRLALPHAHRLYVTRVLADVGGDTVFPSINALEWTLTESKRYAASPHDDHDFVFETHQRGLS